MDRTIITTDGAYKKPPTVSQAVRAGGFVFVSGHVAKDPSTGEIVAGGIVEQTRSVLRQLDAVLTEAGSSLSKIVKVTTFLVRPEDYEAYNETYAEFFPSAPPARSSVVAGTLISAPLGALVEIEALACA